MTVNPTSPGSRRESYSYSTRSQSQLAAVGAQSVEAGGGHLASIHGWPSPSRRVVPPIWTWLTRYYEKSFGEPTGLSPAKMILDSACMFLCSAMLAALFTAGLFQHSFR